MSAMPGTDSVAPTRAQRVVQLAPRFQPDIGGVETHVAAISEELTAQGWQVTVITTQSAQSSSAVESTDYEVIRLPVLPPGQDSRSGWKYKWAVWRAIWQQRHLLQAADVIQVHDVAWWLALVWWLVPHQVWITWHGWETQWPVKWSAKFQRWWWALWAQGVMHVGDWIREYYWDQPDWVSYGGVKAGQSVVPSPKRPKKSQPLQVVFLGRLSQDNQLSAYRELVEQLRQQYQVEVTWVGDGPEAAACARLGKVTGTVADPGSYLQTADVVFASSYLAMLQAQALGKIVVALSGTSPLKQHYLATYPGREFLITTASIETAVEQLSVVWSQSQFREQLSQAATTWAQTQTWFSLAERYQKWWAVPTAMTHRQLLFVTQTLALGGAERFNADWLRAAQKDGWQVTALTNSAEYVTQLQAEGLQADRGGTIIDVIGDWKGLVKALVLWPVAMAQYWMWLRKHSRASAVVMSGYGEKLVVTPLAWLLGISVIWIEFSGLEPVWQKFGGWPRWLYHLVRPLVSTIITPTHQAAVALTAGGVPTDQLMVIPCGRKVSGLELGMAELQPPSDFPKVVCVSRLEPGKGQDLLLKAWPTVLKHYPQAKLELVGTGAWRSDLEKLIQDLKVVESVTLTGRVPSSLAALGAATVCVFPSTWQLEGFGLVVLEAMALSRPVIAFNHGPVTEILRHGQDGWLVDSASPQALAEAIIHVLSHPTLRHQLGQIAAETYQKRFTIEQCWTEYQALIEAKVSDA